MSLAKSSHSFKNLVETTSPKRLDVYRSIRTRREGLEARRITAKLQPLVAHRSQRHFSVTVTA
jgi:hypothetical protein